jgi:trans-AT polyketide synthase/acyltransferase/oxidoreductase domain-containing protein
MLQVFNNLNTPLWVVSCDNRLGIVNQASHAIEADSLPVLAYCPALLPEQLGDPAFCQAYHTRYALYAGAMASGIASEKMILSLGNAGMLGSFGAGGLSLGRIETAIQEIQTGLPGRSYAFNLLHNHFEPLVEQQTVDLYLKYHIGLIEASAFLDVTNPLIQYRVSGLSRSPSGETLIKHRVIAKISRKEIARRFLMPAPQEALNRLLEQKKITPEQVELAGRVPIADDITVEADSGGHTDNRPLVSALPAILSLRDELQVQYGYAQQVRVGAGGGIATPEAALAAFIMGAAYVVTGSVNQACVESGTSEYTRKLLSQADMTDVSMAPAADMFEMGVRVQVLKRGTMFAARAQKLFELFSRYNTLEEIPSQEREKLEKQIFKREIEIIERAEKDPHQKMALVFRWYLGMASRWSTNGEAGREMDYQIWTGPAMGAFNYWVRGTYLAEPANRTVVDVNRQILTGATYLARVRMLALQGIRLAPQFQTYLPKDPLPG